MARTRAEYLCRACGFKTPRPLGRCPTCDAWNSFDEVIQRVESSGASSRVRPLGGIAGHVRPLRLDEIDTAGYERLPIAMEEFSRVLGGGFVKGSMVLVGGD